MADQQINCSDCGDAFVFTQAEQSFYAEKGLTTAPKRCKACRAARKTSQGDRGQGGRGQGDRGQGDRGSGDRGGSRFSPSSPSPRGGGEGGWRPRSPAGAPTGGSGGGGGGGSPGGWDRPRGRVAPRADAPRPRVEEVQSRAPRDGAPPRRGNLGSHGGADFRAPKAAEPAREKMPPRERAPKPKFDITCAECGTTSQVPFKPLEGRQVFCQPCYRARKGTTETAVAGAAIGEADSGTVE